MNVSKIIQSGLLEQYVLGLTSEAENTQIEEYIVAYPEVKQKVQRLRSCMDHYTGIHNIPCPSENRIKKKTIVKKRDNCLFVESKFGKNQITINEDPANYSQKFSLVNFTSLMIFILAGSSLYFYLEHSSNTNRLFELKDRISHLEREYNNASTKINLLELNNQLLTDSRTKKMLMSGTPIAPEAKAVLYYNQAQQQILLDHSSLPHTTPNQCYHIWAELQNSTKVCMGQITPIKTKKEVKLVPLEFVQGINQLFITKEADGQEHPFLQGSFH